MRALMPRPMLRLRSPVLPSFRTGVGVALLAFLGATAGEHEAEAKPQSPERRRPLSAAEPTRPSEPPSGETIEGALETEAARPLRRLMCFARR